MIFIITPDVTVDELPDGTLAVTRPSILGGVHTHFIKSEYPTEYVADYLANRMAGYRTDLIQNVFPKMNADDREFLQSGITPAVWAATFRNDDEEVH